MTLPNESLPEFDEPTGRMPAVTVMVAIAVVVALTLGLSLIGMRAFHASDLLESYAPWRTTAPDGVVPTNRLVGDTVDAVLPARAVFARGLDDGELLMWQPYALGGRPLASIPNKGLFSPLNLPYWLVSIWYAPGLTKLLELAVAIGFTFLFLRSIGLRRSAAALGGLIFAFSGFQVVWTNWPQTHVAALIPALFWAIEFIRRRVRWYAIAPLGAVVGVMWLEGFPSVTGYALAYGGVYALVRALSQRGWRKPISILAISLSGVVMGTALAAFQLLPFLAWTESLDLSARVFRMHLPLRVLATFVVPNAFGSPVDRNYYGPMNYVEIQAFIGIAAVVLVVLAIVYGRKLVSRSVYWYFVGAAFTAVVLMFIPGPLLRTLADIPLFGMNFIGRMRSVLGFLLAVLAAIGFEAVLGAVPRSAPIRDRVVFGGALVITSGVLGGALFRAWQMASAAEQIPYLRTRLAIAGVLFAIVLIAVATAHLRWRKGIAVAAVALPLVVALEAVTIALPFWPQIPVDEFYPVTESHQFLAANLGEERIVAAGLTLYPGTTKYYEIRSVTGHIFHDPAWRDLLEAVDSDVMRSPTFSILPSTMEVANSPVLDRLAARYFVSDYRLPLAGHYYPEHPSGSTRLQPGQSIDLPDSPKSIGVVFHLPVAFDPGANPDIVIVERVDADGMVAAQGFRRITQPRQSGEMQVGLPQGEAGTIRVRYEGDTPLEISTKVGGDPLLSVVTATDDNLKLVHAGSTLIYERRSSLPRIRWAGTALVIEDPLDRVQAIAAGVAPNTVVLSSPIDHGSGLTASVRLETDVGDELTVSVDAEGSGFLVLADTVQSDWTATVDGEPAEILAADHAVAAIAIEAGTHVVHFRYTPAGQPLGLLITLGAFLVLALVLGVSWRRQRSTNAGSAAFREKSDAE